MRIYEVDNYEEMSKKAANIIAAQIMLNPKSVLGLASGSSPIGVYQLLKNKFELGEIDFKNIKTINLDEYKGLSKDDNQSYNYFMHDNLFNYVNIKNKNIFIPNGMCNNDLEECQKYDEIINNNGPIDLQILGLGNNGHIGFNEPNKEFIKNTHLIKLDDSTIKANSRFFENIDDVPKYAYTVGIKPLMDAKCIILLVNNTEKLNILNKALYGEVTPLVPASILQKHNNLIVIKVKKND